MSKLRKVANTVIGLMFLSSSVATAGTDNGNSTSAQQFVEESIQLKPVDPKELMCLARNIFFESRSESDEGKIAVGAVTLNRVEDPRFPNSVCEVVKQKTVISKPRQIKTIKEITTGWGIWKKTEQHVELSTVIDRRVVCQFSWVCEATKRIKKTDAAWINSINIAQRLLSGELDYSRKEMSDWLYFHATSVNPRWHNLKRETRIGAHIFYVEKR